MSIESNIARTGERRGLVKELSAALENGYPGLLAFVERHSYPMCGCWIWLHGTNKAGYAYMSDPRVPPDRRSAKRVIISRLLCEISGKIISPDQLTRHTCDTPACVNPDHLLAGSHQDNCDDKFARGRAADVKGEKNARATITDSDARLIKFHGRRDLASPRITRRIIAGETWKHIAIAFGILLSSSIAWADPPPGTDLNSPRHKWFEQQHSVGGVWCCNLSDGHLLEDSDWRMASDSYEVRIHGQWIKVPEKALRDPNGGPNPTGHAIAWYNISEYGVMLYCFAPGWQG